MFDHVPLILADAYPSDNQAPAGPGTPIQGGGTGSNNSTTQQSGNGSQQLGGGGGGGGLWANPMNQMMIMVLLAMGLLFFFQMRSQRKEKKRRQALLDAITKGTKVLTTSGIIGTVVEMRDTEVVLKVDENSNTRIKFRRDAIQGVLEDTNADKKD